MSTTSTIQSVPLLDLKAQFQAIESEIREALERVLQSQHFILGPEVEAFEAEVAKYSRCQFGVGVSSGSDALLIALIAMGIQPGDEVITTPYTFFATAGAVVRLGAKPVYVDIDPASYNIETKGIAAAITKRTRAIIPVHLYGQMAEMDPILELAERHGLMVIEDAAQAIGAEYKGRRAGSLGHMGCLSFFPSKNLGGFGDGGMVTCRDPQVADRLRLLRNHGYRPKYYNKVVGGNFRLDAIQAAILGVKLKHLDAWTRSRQQNADRYTEMFHHSGLVTRGLVTLPISNAELVASGSRQVCNQFVIRVAAEQREPLREHLKKAKIGTEVYYPLPMHLQECFAEFGHKAGEFPHSEAAAKETIALPIYPELTNDHLQYVVDQINAFYGE